MNRAVQFAAEGYARSTGKAGVCMGTSGPGATNLVTAIADAYMDSCPLIAITGQVNQNMIGRGAFQETDIIGVTLPIVKHSYLVTDVNDIPRIVKEAFYIAQTGRPGPVVIDVPKNIQQAKTQPVWPTLDQIKKGLPGYTQPDLKADEVALNEILGLIEKAERPVIYCGGGIISSGAAEELKKFAEADKHSRDDDNHGRRRFSRNASAFASLARNARRGVCELGGQRRIRKARQL